MRQELLEEFANIEPPDNKRIIAEFGHYEVLKKRGCYAAPPEDIPATALESLARHAKLSPKGVPIVLHRDKSFAHEEFELETTPDRVDITYGDCEGIRRAVYLLEEKHEFGKWRRKPKIRHRVSRCSFAPIGRPPTYRDELMDDVDYYPDSYLDSLAHEHINGLWITMYLKDLPSHFFPSHGVQVSRRLEKLNRIIEKCARYGIKIYVFLAEPKGFNGNALSLPINELRDDMAGHCNGDSTAFCTSSETGLAYLAETIKFLFRNAPELGGIINIMCLESSMPCAGWIIYDHLHGNNTCNCRRCSARKPEDIFAETAAIMAAAMRKVAPDAEFVGWFYFAYFLRGAEEEKHFFRIAEAWPKDCHLMFNFEVGGVARQLGREHPVLDYSLSFIGPSALWREIANRSAKPGAKLQVGCSHEDASVPFIPVPGNLYKKYHEIVKTRCDFVMQCWYFGNYPGVMNMAAGRLSFDPFPKTEDEFLFELIGRNRSASSREIVKVWNLFGKGYKSFPENLNFKWFGPLHNSIVFPWYLFPVDSGMPPTYFFGDPKIGGDRIGEMTGYEHTITETVKLLTRMDRFWQKGLKILGSPSLRNSTSSRDLGLAETIGLQIRSARNLFTFYFLREDMIFNRTNNLEKMRHLVLEEIENTEKMRRLCLNDPRLGYHSEAEGYLFFPEKLEARKNLLKVLLKEDFPCFDVEIPCIKQYRGENNEPDMIICGEVPENAAEIFIASTKVMLYCKNETIFIDVFNENCEMEFLLEPCRLWPTIPFRTNSNDCKFHERRNENGIQRFKIDLTFFREFRRSPLAPVRFNLGIDSVFYRERHDWPPRLLLGSVNPNDLAWLKFSTSEGAMELKQK